VAEKVFDLQAVNKLINLPFIWLPTTDGTLSRIVPVIATGWMNGRSKGKGSAARRQGVGIVVTS
jgi:hypothetical protein